MTRGMGHSFEFETVAGLTESGFPAMGAEEMAQLDPAAPVGLARDRSSGLAVHGLQAATPLASKTFFARIMPSIALGNPP